MLSVVIQAFKKSVMFLFKTFMNRCLIYSNWACIAHQPNRIHPVKIHLISIRDSPDHRSGLNKEVKFIIMNLLSGAEI